MKVNTNKSWNNGKQNSQYGTCWICNINERKSIKIKKEELNTYISNGWVKGRCMFNNDTNLYKKHWYHNDELQINRLFDMFNVPTGWEIGKKDFVNTAPWCNGSTSDSKPFSYSSNLYGATNYKELSKENIIDYVSHNSGVYHIHNMLNGKSYIGQAKILRKRLLAHLTQFNNGNRKYPIYKAFAKYGLESFEFAILSTYNSNDSDLQKKLDNDEAKYIKEYNSYGATGYNQTYGGDAGITGYKMTDDQRAHISRNAKKQAMDGRYKLYVYNLNTKTYEEYLNTTFLSEHYGFKIYGSSLSNLVINGFLIIARTKEKLEEKINKFKVRQSNRRY